MALADRMASLRLGTSIVKALAHQLDAKMETLADAKGTTISVTHATFSGRAAH
jgi:two-component sensor histidine kinase